MDTTRYNGWTNYATWNVALWVGNDEPVYRAMIAHPRFTMVSARTFARVNYPGGTPDLKGKGGFAGVDWQAIADAWNEDKPVAVAS